MEKQIQVFLQAMVENCNVSISYYDDDACTSLTLSLPNKTVTYTLATTNDLNLMLTNTNVFT